MRCLILDDSARFVAAARALLEHDGVTIVGAASSGAEALRLYEELRPDVTLVDVNLGEESGFTVVEQLHQAAGDAVASDLDFFPRRAGKSATASRPARPLDSCTKKR